MCEDDFDSDEFDDGSLFYGGDFALVRIGDFAPIEVDPIPAQSFQFSMPTGVDWTIKTESEKAVDAAVAAFIKLKPIEQRLALYRIKEYLADIEMPLYEDLDFESSEEQQMAISERPKEVQEELNLKIKEQESERTYQLVLELISTMSKEKLIAIGDSVKALLQDK